MAKTLNIPYFASDEANIQPIIDKHLNVGTEYDIEVVRVEHIVKWIKENKDCGIGRKTAKALLCLNLVNRDEKSKDSILMMVKRCFITINLS